MLTLPVVISRYEEGIVMYRGHWFHYYGIYALRLGRGYIVHVGYGITISDDERSLLALFATLAAMADRHRVGI